MRAAVITASDRCSRGERPDSAGEAARERLEATGAEVVFYRLVPDERKEISEAVRLAVDEHGADLVLTAGGTGLGPRDVTPEATMDVIAREVPGVAGRIREMSLQHTPYAALSRGVAGQRGRALIVNLPGSEKAVRETIDIVLEVADHAMQMMAGDDH